MTKIAPKRSMRLFIISLVFAPNQSNKISALPPDDARDKQNIKENESHVNATRTALGPPVLEAVFTRAYPAGSIGAQVPQ